MEEGKEREERRHELHAGRAGQARKKFLFVSKPFTHINDAVLVALQNVPRNCAALFFAENLSVFTTGF